MTDPAPPEPTPGAASETDGGADHPDAVHHVSLTADQRRVVLGALEAGMSAARCDKDAASLQLLGQVARTVRDSAGGRPRRRRYHWEIHLEGADADQDAIGQVAQVLQAVLGRNTFITFSFAAETVEARWDVDASTWRCGACGGGDLRVEVVALVSKEILGDQSETEVPVSAEQQVSETPSKNWGCTSCGAMLSVPQRTEVVSR